MRKLYSFVLASACVAASGVGAWTTACSSTTTGTGIADGGGGTGGTGGNAGGGGPSTGAGGGGSVPPGAGGGGGVCQSCSCLPAADLVCDQNTDAGACPDCCVSGHQSGVATFFNAVIQNCCAPCQAACAATLCSPSASSPDQLCLNCIDGQLAPDSGTSCEATVTAACNASNDCVAYANCSACCPP